MFGLNRFIWLASALSSRKAGERFSGGVHFLSALLIPALFLSLSLPASAEPTAQSPEGQATPEQVTPTLTPGTPATLCPWKISFAFKGDSMTQGRMPFIKAFPPLSGDSPICLVEARKKAREVYNLTKNGAWPQYADDKALEAFLDLFSDTLSASFHVYGAYDQWIANGEELPFCLQPNCGKKCLCALSRNEYNTRIEQLKKLKAAKEKWLRCDSAVRPNTASRHYSGACTSGSFLIDRDCKPISEGAYGECATQITALQIRPSSPISLIWEDRFDIESARSIVRFPLDPALPDRWYEWQGSGSAPLLVYDPNHTGNIISASQLFGNWTFGGRERVALKDLGTNLSSQAAPWGNGYEALATLDRDGDGEVSGGELHDLALWFDYNRDAKSQPGEVKRLGDVGVTRLLVGPVAATPGSRNVSVARGFTRVVEGREVVGKTVDWFSDGAATQMELVMRHRVRALDEKRELPLPFGGSELTGSSEELQSPLPLPAAKFVQDSKIAGAWTWGADEDGAMTRGVLLLDEYEDGAIFATSISEVPVSDPSQAVVSMMAFQALEGHITRRGEDGIEFELASPSAITVGARRPNKVISNVVFDPKSKKLSGTTTEVIYEGTKEASVTYSWHAKNK